MSAARIRVFLVDDHPLVREWLGNLLRLEPDIEVVGEAEEPAAALAAMLARPPDVPSSISRSSAARAST